MGSRATIRGPFRPNQQSAIGAWYRLGASTATGGEYQTVVDMLGGTGLTQNDTDRRLAATASANGLPTATYDGTDCMRMALGSNNFSTSKFGLAYWIKPQTLGTTQRLFVIYNNDATVRVLTMSNTATGRIFVEIFIGTNTDGRSFVTASGALTANTFCYPRLQLDMTKTNECDTTGSITDAKVRVFVGETSLALTAADFGVGGTLTTLRTPTGSAIFGGLNDSDTPTSPVLTGSVHGPNTYVFTDTPTAAGAQILMNFEVPT